MNIITVIIVIIVEKKMLLISWRNLIKLIVMKGTFCAHMLLTNHCISVLIYFLFLLVTNLFIWYFRFLNLVKIIIIVCMSVLSYIRIYSLYHFLLDKYFWCARTFEWISLLISTLMMIILKLLLMLLLNLINNHLLVILVLLVNIKIVVNILTLKR